MRPRYKEQNWRYPLTYLTPDWPPGTAHRPRVVLRYASPSGSGSHVEWKEAVYRCYDGSGTLLYVGCSKAVGRRLGVHRREAGWWREVRSILIEMVHGWRWEYEYELINRLRPLYNPPQEEISRRSVASRIAKRELRRAAAEAAS
jgi:hypothetical protein